MTVWKVDGGSLGGQCYGNPNPSSGNSAVVPEQLVTQHG